MLRDAPPPYRTIVFDCDSTLSAIEGIDELAAGHRAEVSALTERAMQGELALEDVYKYRLELIRPTRASVERVGALYVERVLPNARALVRALQHLGKRVFIVSGGLEPAVLQLAASVSIPRADVRSVAIFHDEHGAYAGFDESSPLTRSGGKIEVVRSIAGGPNTRPVALVGDGMTDLEAAEADGAAARFIAFGGAVRRIEVFERALVTCDQPDLAALVPHLLSEEEIDILARTSEHAPLARAARTIT